MYFIKNKNFWLVLFADILALVFCYTLAYWLRFDGSLPSFSKQGIANVLAPLIVVKVGCFLFFDLYRGMWRYAGIRDLINVIKAAVTGSFLFVVYLAMFHHFAGISRSVLIADGIFTVVAIGGIRLLIRVYYQRDPEFLDELLFWRASYRDCKKAFIVGTGTMAEHLLREIASNPSLKYRIVGFFDTNGSHKGMKIHGIPILGSLAEIEKQAAYYAVDEILFAEPGISPDEIDVLVEKCAQQRIEFKKVPAFDERMQKGRPAELRKIKVEDLLEREPVRLDMDMVRSEIEGRRVLVTGAAGSIGSELCRQILKFRPERIILVDNAETPLYRIDMELQRRTQGTAVYPCIGDVRSSRSLERIFRKHNPDVVYHAAAYKHVPMMELTPLDAVNNNIMGTFKLATVACKYHVAKFVMISTDKAVRPTSVMGATKRVAEMIVQTMNGNGTRFAVVRFGNVLGSNGSVVPLFEQQIAEGGPVTVTHPEVTRYFMTIPEAAMLVLQAGTICGGSELFLLDMGNPVKIVDLARKMIKLAGKVPDRDIRIDFIGLRPGEKLYEELLIEDENVVDTAFDKIKICRKTNLVDDKILYGAIEKFKLLIDGAGDQGAAVALLQMVVPAFARSGEVYEVAPRGQSSAGLDPARPL